MAAKHRSQSHVALRRPTLQKKKKKKKKKKKQKAIWKEK
jgi:hypothetical protein